MVRGDFEKNGDPRVKKTERNASLLNHCIMYLCKVPACGLCTPFLYYYSPSRRLLSVTRFPCHTSLSAKFSMTSIFRARNH